MVFNVINKKYQPIKLFINENESVIIGAKESKKINVIKLSQHLSDLEKSGFISIKKIEGVV
jgi:hypothetical protein